MNLKPRTGGVCEHSGLDIPGVKSFHLSLITASEAKGFI